MEIVDENIYEPLDLYKNKFKEEHAENVKEYFEELVKKSGVNEQQNIATVKDIRVKEKQIADVSHKAQKKRSLRGFLIFVTVLGFIAAAISIYALVESVTWLPPYAFGLILAGGLLLAVGMILIITLKVNKAIKSLDLIKANLTGKKDALVQAAWQEMEPLNVLYDWGMTAELIEKTIPLVKMDRYFDSRRFDYLHTKYGLMDNSNKNRSALFVQSGEIIGNPFLLARTLNFHMGQKTYTGSLTISWTETRYVNGKMTTQYRTQVLTASVTKPYPEYNDDTVLIYGNEAAPDLSFSREPTLKSGMSEKAIDKMVDKQEKKIEKMERKSVAKGGNFTSMGNSEFDALFHALNRNNEVQFRLLFTPLAQKQLLELIKDNEVGYGDDFFFEKEKELNYIRPRHLAGADIYANPGRYSRYELADERRTFNAYNNDFFKQFYFAMAPILAIPLYQQQKPHDYIYKDVYPSAVSAWEHEAVVNAFADDTFKHPTSVTKNILKTNLIAHGDNYDEVTVTASGYTGVARTDYIPVSGGDGRVHQVPVNWTEYLPVSNSKNVAIKVADDLPRRRYIDNINGNPEWKQLFSGLAGSTNNVIFRRSLIAFVLTGGFGLAENQKLSSVLVDPAKKVE